MTLSCVTGSVVSTRKSERFRGSNLLLVQPVNLDGDIIPHAAEQVALDPGLDAGLGDTVLVAKEGAVIADLFDDRLAPHETATPANVVIIAIVDSWSKHKAAAFPH